MQGQPKVVASAPPSVAAPQSTPIAAPQSLQETKKVFYFDGEDMIKRDAMVQLSATGDDNAEYPYLHVHTQDGENIDPMTGIPVTIVHGYSQHSFVQTKGDDNAEYPFLHVHTQDGQDVDPLTGIPVNIVHGYSQRDQE